MKSESDEDISLEAVLSDLRSILWDLRDIETDIGRLQDMVDTGDTSARSKGSDNLDELRKTIDTTANVPDNLEELHVLWSQYYFLEQCLGYLGDYYGNLGNSYQSLPAVKDLLRAAYSFSKFEQAQQTNSTQKAREEPIQLPYVPENYFGSTGQTMFVDGEWKGSVRTEGVEELFRKYTPYRTQYASDGTVLDIFQPPTTKLSDNSIRFDTTGFDGTERGDLLVPDRIKLKRVRDVSGNDGDAIIRYCPECLEILDDQVSDCPEHGKGVTGTIYSEPQIATEVREFTQSQDEANSDEARTADQGVDIRCGNLKANLWLDLVELNVREYIRIGDGSYIHRNGEDAERKVTAEPDSRLGYTIETRGIKWSIEEIAGELVDDELTDLLDQRGSLTELQPTRLVYHTAAHFLQQVVADVSGVNSSMLKYDYDIESGTVHVFEETEGGQGIADLFIDTLESDTSRVLQAASHVGYDIRLVNERVWSDPDVLGRIRRLLSVQDESVNSDDELNKLLSDKLAVGGTTEADDHIEDVIRNAHVPNGVKPDQLSDSLHADVIQEFKSTLGRVNEVSSGNLSVSDTLTLKSEAAQHTLEGESMDDLLIQTAIKITETQEQMLELLWANNVDGGLETLQLRQCLAHNRSEQADTLSQEVAQRLWVELTNLTSN